MDVSSASECSDNESDDSDSRELEGYRCQNCFVTGKLNLSLLAVTFANRLDPDQARQKVVPDLDPICLTL